MENKVALVNKSTNRVENIIIVSSLDDAPNWETNTFSAIPVQENQTAYVYGIWNGNDFQIPENEYLISIGILNLETPEENIIVEENINANN